MVFFLPIFVNDSTNNALLSIKRNSEISPENGSDYRSVIILLNPNLPLPVITLMTESDFFVVALEPGAENPQIPTWANRGFNPGGLDYDQTNDSTRIEVTGVPGTFQILNILNDQECNRISGIADRLGFVEDAAVSLPRSVRHNDSMTWVVDDETSSIIWQRCEKWINQELHLFSNRQALGLNNRFRFYRYRSGDYFSPHTDGAWPGSKVIDGELIHNAFDDRWSQLTFLLFLTDDYQGGATQFLVEKDNLQETEVRGCGRFEKFDVRTPKGGVLCFPHGSHPMHCLHSSTPVTEGEKQIIRSDVLFEL